MLGFLALVVAIIAIATSIWAISSRNEADHQKRIAEANVALAQEQLDRQAGLALLQEAYELKEQDDALGAIEKLRAAEDLGMDIEVEIEDVRRQGAIHLVQEGEIRARMGDIIGADEKFEAALALDPPPDVPVYIYVPAGEFLMGAGTDDIQAFPDQRPQHKVWVDGYWIQRTEVTNALYKQCVQADICDPPRNSYWDKQQYADIPVTHVDWFQANAYATWVGGRLPTEAEWERACRGDDSRRFSWGNSLPSPERVNFSESGLPLPSEVGSYPAGAYGLYDMSGNVWEWTSSMDLPYPYVANDGRENQNNANARILRGGAFGYDGDFDFGVSCTVRGRGGPDGLGGYYGFRVVRSPGF